MTTKLITISTHRVFDIEEHIAHRLNEIYAEIEDKNPSLLHISFDGYATSHGKYVKGHAQFCEFVQKMNDEFWEKDFKKRLVLDKDQFVWKAPEAKR